MRNFMVICKTALVVLCGLTACKNLDNINITNSFVSAFAEESAPNYNNASTYSETDTIASVIEYIIQNYPVDKTCVYSTGFSNGGAMSVALCRDYPQLFAGIATFGWMVDMPDKMMFMQHMICHFN